MPWGGVLAHFCRPGAGVGILNFFFAQGVGNSPIKEIDWGFCPGGWSGLELTDI